MIPMTRKKKLKPTGIFPPRTIFCGISFSKVAQVISLYGVISSLLLPLTVYVITGQYGVMMYRKPEKHRFDDNHVWRELLPLTDASVERDVFLIALLSLVHLLGYISIYKNRPEYIFAYVVFRACEFCFIFVWMSNVCHEYIRSHTISHSSLIWCCLFSMVMETISASLIAIALAEAMKNKNE